ncbi:hypothetical protein M8C21_004293 [Ambrosia artemisiifolia]|uniref:Uncharacterized protein n=1 Tax=Ambrosia artemisiifolia TaxID=4212 RepID=A0AAD5G1U6_AMBAR|nr:hypothetical protein M8C21_004293 [Ambrosia artemisiifolia]
MAKRTQSLQRLKHSNNASRNQIRFTPLACSYHRTVVEKENTYFMETSALESVNVDNAFTEVLTQIYHVVSRKALDIGGDSAALPKGQTVNVGSIDDVSAMKKVGCCCT